MERDRLYWAEKVSRTVHYLMYSRVHYPVYVVGCLASFGLGIWLGVSL